METGFNDFKEYLSLNGYICGYLFRIFKFGKYVLYEDCD